MLDAAVNAIWEKTRRGISIRGFQKVDKMRLMTDGKGERREVNLNNGVVCVGLCVCFKLVN